ncbi:MAG TPA: hypothetical protein DCX53_14145 [Anaerolineae bacterium]|nr:hypothetical protein [Anaerolineae bacterium]
MGKYVKRQKQKAGPTRNTVNPYMRGIGCLLMLIVPVFSYFVGDTLAENNFGIQVLPADWYGYMSAPPWVANFTGLSAAARSLGSIPHLPATLAFAALTMIVVGGLTSVIFGFMYSMFAPSRYGPMDVPPPRVKTKKYKR